MKKIISSSFSGVTLIQALPVEGNRCSLLHGNYTTTMSIIALKKRLSDMHPTEDTENILGLGATPALSNEISINGSKAYLISGVRHVDGTTSIKTSPLPEDTELSFAQASINNVVGITKTVEFDKIKAENSEGDTYEINHGGAFKVLLEAIGSVKSAVVSITADVSYIKTRAVCPTIEGTNRKLSVAAGLKTMMLGGDAVDGEGNTVKVLPQVIQEKQDDGAFETVEMNGFITGSELLENNVLKGLHIHCKYGHILDLGQLRNVKVQYTPIKEIITFLPGDGKFETSGWHTLLTKHDSEKIAAIKKLQYFCKKTLFSDRETLARTA